jgi:hypothetical protein
VSEFSQYLPFSQRPPRDESAVTSNWAGHTRAVLTQLTDVLEGLSEAEWHSISRRTALRTEELDVHTIVAELLWKNGTRSARISAVVRSVITKRCLPAEARASLIQNIAERGSTSLVREISGLLAAYRNPGATASVGELGDCVAALCEIGETTRHTVSVDPVASGAVAIAASLSAPFAIRAVLQRNHISASDARSVPETDDGWSVGRGRRLHAPASAIVLFLYGRRGFPEPAGG